MAETAKTEAWMGIVEDGLDIVMLVGSVTYIVVLNETELSLSPETMAVIGGAGGTLRLILRRLLRRIVSVRIVKGPKDEGTEE